LDDDWAAALAEQSQAEAEPPSPESTVSSSETDGQPEPAAQHSSENEEPPSTEASLDDDWAAALAEQSQAETEPPVPENTASSNETDAQPEPAPDNEEPPSTEASLEDDWAAALAEQNQTDTLPEQAESTSEENAEAQAGTSPSDVHETSKSSPDNGEDSENDWAAILEDQEQPQPEAQQVKTTPTNNDPASDDSDKVVMDWPNGGSDQSQEEQLAASAASSDEPTHSAEPDPPSVEETSPPPEFSLAAAAAKASIQAVMEKATDVSEVIQDNQAREQLEASDSASDKSPTQPPTETATSKNLAEAAAAPETPELDQTTQHPDPPIPNTSALNIEQAPDRFRRPFFTGTGGSRFGMFTMNTLLTLLTFGVYSFWARIKIRRYLHSQTKFGGARLAFHGTGGELLKGWMKAVAVFGIPYSALNYAGMVQTDVTLQWGVNIVAGLFILCFIPIAIVGSHRYRMTRTSWRGIYFSFRNSAKDFFTLYLKGMLFSILTLGIYYPIFDNAKRAFLVSGTHFGNRAFGFDGEAKELGSIYFKAFRLLILGLVTAEAVLLATPFLSGQANPNQIIEIVFWTTIAMALMVIPFVIGIWFWFQATKQRYMWSHTTFGPARFHATMTGTGLFELKLTNLFLLICTLGLAWPWVQTRNLQFLYFHVGLQGPLNLKQVVQEAGTASPMGEELAGFFDTGFDLG
jgi:uncharacterized membrane protein YjgN (DUF898 family)